MLKDKYYANSQWLWVDLILFFIYNIHNRYVNPLISHIEEKNAKQAFWSHLVTKNSSGQLHYVRPDNFDEFRPFFF